MNTQHRNPLARVAAALFFFVALAAGAHEGHSVPFAVPQAPDASVPSVSASGFLHALPVEDRVSGVTTRSFWLQLDDGSTVALLGSGLDDLAVGQHLEVTGRSVGTTLFVANAVATKATTANAPIVAATSSVEGTLAVVHADYFAEGRGDYNVVVIAADGNPTILKFPVVSESLRVGMSVRVQGTLAADGTSLSVQQVTILALPPVENATTSGTTTNNVLVMAVKFTDSPAADAFTPATINTEFQTKVAALYAEQSYGQQLLNVTVACYTGTVPSGCAAGTATGGWLKGIDPTSKLPIATPASCNYTTVGQAADAAATQAGYNLANYKNRFYIMPSNSACGGWAGLAYIGYPYQAWGNGYYQLWVAAHELGHNFTLWHSGILNCSGSSVGTGCAAGDEYGDPWDAMGNRYPGHFNSLQKSALNWLPAGTVKTQTAGTSTYTLSPLESAGQSTYAIRIPAASNRTYWIEYRQPIGFDNGNPASFNGAQIRVSGRSPDVFQFPCSGCGGDDTQTFNSAPILVGQTYTDTDYSINIHVVSQTASALTLSVSMPGSVIPAPNLTGAVSRKTHGSAGTFDLPLSLVATNPSTEPRTGPSQTVVFTFDKAVSAANVSVTEGTAVAAAPTFSGNSVVVSLTGVTNSQYVTVTLSNVSSSDGGAGGAASARIGFLAGDVNQNRVVSVADVALINAALAQTASASNYLKDVNASGSVTVADRAIATVNLAHALPAP